MHCVHIKDLVYFVVYNMKDLVLCYLIFCLDNDGVIVLLGDHKAREERGFKHVDEEIISENIQFLLLISGHISRTRNTIPLFNT